MKGREGDQWYKGVAAKPVDAMAATLVFAGFDGIYIDRHGYEDRAAALEAQLTQLLSAGPIVSQNQRLAFFNLAPLAGRLRQQVTSEEWAVRRDLALYPLFLSWRKFGPETVDGNQTFRWCGPNGQLQILNRSAFPRQVEIQTAFRTNRDEPANLRLSGPLADGQLKIDAHHGEWTATLIVPPGKSEVQFACDGPVSDQPGTPANAVFRVVNFRSREMRPVLP